MQPLTTQEDRDEAKKLEEKLNQLKILKDEGKLTQEDYNQVRLKLIAASGKGKIAPPGTPKP